MRQLPVIYAIQASDAPLHTDRLRKILKNLENENRIRDFRMLGGNDDLSFIMDSIGEEDLILIVLTHQLEASKEHIENRFRVLKSKQPGTRIAEILVDNVVYDHEYITFPVDLLPFRNREDLDSAWGSFEESLKNMFPARKKPEQRDQPGIKPLDAVKKHPDYPGLLKVKPGSAYLFGHYMIYIIFGFIFTSVAIFFISVPPDSDTLFDLVWVIGSLAFIIIGIGIVGYGIYRIIKLAISKLKRLPSLILDKRITVRGGGQSSTASTYYYITLELTDGERQELETRGKLYGKITKNDVGVAYIRDRYLLDFRRVMINE